MHGKGHMIFADGKQYIGDYDKDVRHGNGKFIWPDGREYDGRWVAGKQFGEGYYTGKDGIAKKGVWVDGKREKWLDEGDTESVISLTVQSEMSRSKCRYNLGEITES